MYAGRAILSRILGELRPRPSASGESARCFASVALRDSPAAIEGADGTAELKRMNLFTAVNDALHIALDADPK
jgi:hypothetical protein